jgi:signal transduction histidine kinase
MCMLRNEDSVEPRPRPSTSDRRIRLLIVLAVVVGYIVTFAFNAILERRIPIEELFWGILFGVIYTLLGLFDWVIFDRLPTGWAGLLFFSVQCSLVFGIGLFLGIGNFVMVMPLVGFAVERLKPWPRLVVYVALAAAVVLPLGLRYDTWASALISGAGVSTAILFMAIFAHMRMSEQQARERAERLMAELEKANAQLAAYATQAQELAMIQERNRLAREIHDNLGHTFTIMNVQIEAAKAVMDSDPDRALDAMDKAQELARKGLTDVRQSVAALRESPVSNRTLGEAIAALVKEAGSSGIVTEFQVSGEPRALENKVALALYRPAPEARLDQNHWRVAKSTS